MSTTRKNQLKKVMQLAWQFVKKNGFTLSEALKVAWANVKLHTAMQIGIVKFYFQKVDGTIREAFGTLKSSTLPPTKESKRTPNPTCQVYYDTEKEAYRCFKKANLIRVEMY